MNEHERKAYGGCLGLLLLWGAIFLTFYFLFGTVMGRFLGPVIAELKRLLKIG